jgi:DNA uptake protein ComE-like DNA-binding protein
MSFRSRSLLNFVFLAVVTGGVCGCGLFQSDNRSEEQKRESEQKTRDEVAKATERAKPELQKAGRELKEAAKTAAEQAHAAAEGVKDGWERSGKRSIDLNSASESELTDLPGITRRTQNHRRSPL